MLAITPQMKILVAMRAVQNHRVPPLQNAQQFGKTTVSKPKSLYSLNLATNATTIRTGTPSRWRESSR